MKQARKHLAISSILVLLFTVFTFLRVGGDFLFSDQGTAILPDGYSETVEQVTRIILLTVTFVFLLPQFYVGVKGVCIAIKPSSARGHIIWGCILLVFTILGMIEPVTTIIQRGSLSGNAYALFSGLFSTVLYCYYIKSARAVR